MDPVLFCPGELLSVSESGGGVFIAGDPGKSGKLSVTLWYSTYIYTVVDFTSLFFVLPPLDGFINQDACIVMHILCKCSMSNE